VEDYQTNQLKNDATDWTKKNLQDPNALMQGRTSSNPFIQKNAQTGIDNILLQKPTYQEFAPGSLNKQVNPFNTSAPQEISVPNRPTAVNPTERSATTIPTGKPPIQQNGYWMEEVIDVNPINRQPIAGAKPRLEPRGAVATTNMTGIQKEDAFPELSGKPLLEKLRTVPKTGVGDYAMVKGIVDGQMPFDKWGSAKDPIERARIQKLVLRVDPLFDAQWVAGIGALKKDAVAGKTASQLQGMNQLLGHLEEYKQSYEQLNNKAISLGNTVKNYIAENTGDPDVTAFRTAEKAVISEGAGVFKTGQGAASPTTEEIKDWAGVVSLASSPEQYKAFGTMMAKLLKSRISAIGNRLNVIPNKPKEFQLLSPKAQESLLGWGVDINDLTGGQTSPAVNSLKSKYGLE
jgi:hypothetical protein